MNHREEAPSASTYYDLPLLKEPVWTWEVPAYFFVGGAAGAAAAIGAIARVAGADHMLVRHARWMAAAGGAVSPALLISDLGRPERFLNMLRVFKPQSPMSVGAWTLVAFSSAAAGVAAADLVQRTTGRRLAVRLIGDAAEVLSAATGLVLATYTGVLIGATAVPVWSRNVRLLPIQFGTSSLGAAASILELLGHPDRSLNRLALTAAALETSLGLGVDADVEPARDGLREGGGAILTRVGEVLSGPLPLALRLLGGRSRGARRVAATSSIAGSLLTRIGWIAAGRTSARASSRHGAA